MMIMRMRIKNNVTCVGVRLGSVVKTFYFQSRLYTMATKRWFHPNLNGLQAEALLKDKGVDGSFLCRPSTHNPGDFTLSVRRGDDVTNIRIQNQGDFYDLYGGEKFATLAELILYYTDNPGHLKEKSGSVIQLTSAINCEEVTAERWYHGGLTGRDAEVMLSNKGQDGSFLVRASSHSPGNYVLSARVAEDVSHVIIRHSDDLFDMGGGPQFNSLNDLIEHYKKNPLIETSGRVIYLKHPFHSTSFLPRNIRLRVTELEKQNQDMYGKAGFWEEFEQMQQQECRHLYSRKEGSKAENRPKNRFKNILPFDHTRVPLTGVDPDVPGSSYINANYISGEAPDSYRCYVATQGCLPSTMSDFWHMVWQERSLVIVMITNEVERGRNKCAHYWPGPEEPGVYGAMKVTSLEETILPHYILRHFLVANVNEGCKEERHTFQFHFKAWPDHGVPADPGIVLGFMEDVNAKTAELKADGSAPGATVVHCSAGIGRTGTYIIIDMIIKFIESVDWDTEIDVQRSVQCARSQRSGMVQTEQQYKFVYRAILHYVEANQQRMTAALSGSQGQGDYGNFNFPPGGGMGEAVYGNVPSSKESRPPIPPKGL